MGRRGAALVLPRAYTLNWASVTTPRVTLQCVHLAILQCYLLLTLHVPARCRTSATARLRPELGRCHHSSGPERCRFSATAHLRPELWYQIWCRYTSWGVLLRCPDTKGVWALCYILCLAMGLLLGCTTVCCSQARCLVGRGGG